MSLEEAVEETRADKTARLHVARSISEDLGELRGFMSNSAYALERAPDARAGP